jgi:hypothetical protein
MFTETLANVVGRSSRPLIPLRPSMALINVDNSAKPNISKTAQEADNVCFKYAVCVGRFHDTFVKKLRRYQLSKPAVWKPYFHNLDWTGISFPTSMADIDTFKKNNPDIIVNVWTLEEDELHCEVARRSSRKVVEGQTHSINLLMLCAPGDDGGFLNHFTTILNIGTFRRTGKACKKFPCLTCTHLFNTAQLLQQHTDQGCHIAENGAVEVMPTIYSVQNCEQLEDSAPSLCRLCRLRVLSCSYRQTAG